MDPSIIQLFGLSVAEVALLTTAGITNTEEFMGMRRTRMFAVTTSCDGGRFRPLLKFEIMK
jgi:hypothetical protein